MEIVSSPEILREKCSQWRKNGETIALVPTMGYCHDGHKSLMSYGRRNADRLVVTVFVNPAQFGPNEDLERYPRDIERDTLIAEGQGADLLFMPEATSMYDENHATWVEVPEMANGLCGKTRPVHFRGVCTIVLKLLLLTMPDIAIFGEKDWQQQAILRRMVKDLNLTAQIVACPIVREADGLALSSRNVYLSPEERKQAPAIHKALLAAREMVQKGEADPENLVNMARTAWEKEMPAGVPEYISIVHPESLKPLDKITDKALMACAVKLGKARLIDNIVLK